jgi:hypothetical protein
VDEVGVVKLLSPLKNDLPNEHEGFFTAFRMTCQECFIVILNEFLGEEESKE